MSLAAAWAARLYGAGWEIRRRAYAMGLIRPVAVSARVVSIGNLTVGGTGKTTLVLHLAARALERGIDVGVICRRYRPGPGGEGDEERLYADRLGAARVYAGRSKWRLAERAAAAGRSLLLVDDGFQHWRLHRDLDVLLIDASDPFGGERLLPWGRMREPFRAVQRAGAVVLTRAAQPVPALARRLRTLAPAALHARGAHRVTGIARHAGTGLRARLVTATGNPAAVERSAREAGVTLTGSSVYRDHHWFTAAEARYEAERAAAEGAFVLLTAKDAVRWPAAGGAAAVLEVAWTWHEGGEALERRVFEEENG